MMRILRTNGVQCVWITRWIFPGSQCPMPAPSVFAIKGISDFADEKKGDGARHYASFTSSRTLVEWARRFL